MCLVKREVCLVAKRDLLKFPDEISKATSGRCSTRLHPQRGYPAARKAATKPKPKAKQKQRRRVPRAKVGA